MNLVKLIEINVELKVFESNEENDDAKSDDYEVTNYLSSTT